MGRTESTRKRGPEALVVPTTTCHPSAYRPRIYEDGFSEPVEVGNHITWTVVVTDNSQSRRTTSPLPIRCREPIRSVGGQRDLAPQTRRGRQAVRRSQVPERSAGQAQPPPDLHPDYRQAVVSAEPVGVTASPPPAVTG